MSDDEIKGKVTGRTASLINWIQSLRLPCSRRYGEDRIPLISGLDKVVFGTRSASETVRIAGTTPPQYLWFMISGGICDSIQLSMDYVMHFYVRDPSICWAVCFTASVAFRHSTHRYLVFGNYVGGYWKSLARIYLGYSVTIVSSTVFNIVMTKSFQISHYVAWIITLLWTGIVNFLILKKFWSFGGIKPAKTSPKAEKGESSVTVLNSHNDIVATDVELAMLRPTKRQVSP